MNVLPKYAVIGQRIIDEFGADIPFGHGVVIIHEYDVGLLQSGEPIKITDMTEAAITLNLRCAGAAGVHEHELIFVLYREKIVLSVEQYLGEPIFQRLAQQAMEQPERMGHTIFRDLIKKHKIREEQLIISISGGICGIMVEIDDNRYLCETSGGAENALLNLGFPRRRID